MALSSIAPDTRAAWLLPALAAIAVFLLLSPALLLQPNTPSGYDLGGHVYPYTQGLDLLRTEGRVHGWSHGWFGGFPLFYFYFPLPVLPLALFSPFVGTGAALKLTSVLGVLLFPFSAYLLFRGLALSRVAAGAGAVLAATFLFMQSFWFLGGNIASTLAGEFSYGLSFALSIAYLGVILRAREQAWRGAPWAALLLAGSALSHIVTTLIAVLATLPLLLDRVARNRVLLCWVHGFAIAGFWTLPFLARSGFLPHMGWTWQRSVSDILPFEIWPVVPFALVGAALLARRGTHGAALLVMAIAAAIVWLLPQQKFLPTRPLPYWYFALHALAAYVVACAIEARLRQRATTTRLVLGAAAGLALLSTHVLRDVGALHAWAQFNFSGYESKPGWDEYRGLMDVLRALPPGRVHWEDAAALQRYGSPHALTLVPYWTEHDALGGLWVESSLATPAVLMTKKETSLAELTRADPRLPASYALALDRGVAHMRALGVRYYVAYTPDAVTRAESERALGRIAATPAWVLYELSDAAIVRVASHLPSVLESSDFAQAAESWFGAPERLDHWLARAGPSAWPRIVDAARVVDSAPVDATGTVSDVRLDGERVSFRTSAVGVPHLVRVGWFPNWRAQGADGPYFAAPAFMIVVPTQQDVTLVFEQGLIERVGRLVTLLGLLGLLGPPLLRRFPSPQRASSGAESAVSRSARPKRSSNQ